jgi:hypothetical protein
MERNEGGEVEKDYGYAGGGIINLAEGGETERKILESFPDGEGYKALQTGKIKTRATVGTPESIHKAEHIRNVMHGYTLGTLVSGNEDATFDIGDYYDYSQNKAQGGIINLAEGGAYPRLNGLTMGPGGETGDEIPAMLSDGEFVMNAEGMRGGGAMSLLEKGAPMSMIQDPSQQRLEGARLMYAQQAMGEALADALRYS